MQYFADNFLLPGTEAVIAIKMLQGPVQEITVNFQIYTSKKTASQPSHIAPPPQVREARLLYTSTPKSQSDGNAVSKHYHAP